MSWKRGEGTSEIISVETKIRLGPIFRGTSGGLRKGDSVLRPKKLV